MLKPELRLYDASGDRQPLPDALVKGWEFELLALGGCGTFSLSLSAELDDQDVTLPEVGGRLDIFFDGSPIYRGYVGEVTPPIARGAPDYRVTGSGLALRLKSLPVDCIFVWPGGVNATEVVNWIADHFLSDTEQVGYFQRSMEDITGYTVERADFTNQDARQAIDRIAEGVPNNMIWGMDFFLYTDPDTGSTRSVNRLYVKERPTAMQNDDYFLRIGKNITYLEDSRSIAEVVNSLLLIGGKAKSPNLVYNPSFEIPIAAGTNASGNLFQNPSFEDGSGGFADHWTLSGGVRKTSDPSRGEDPRTGEFLVELDNTGETLENTDPVVLPDPEQQKKYKLVLHYSIAGQPASANLTVSLEGLDDADAHTEDLLLNEPLPVTSRSYQEKVWTVNLADPDTTKLRLHIEHDGTGTGTKDVNLDDLWLFEYGIVAQDGWEIGKPSDSDGAAVVDWADMIDPFHGSYNARLTITGTDGTDANSVWLQPTSDHWITAKTRTDYDVAVWVRTTDTINVRLGLERKKNNGSTSKVWETAVVPAPSGEWVRLSATLSSDTSVVSVRPLIEFRDDGEITVGGVDLSESGIEARTDFLPGETLEFRFRSDNGAGSVELPEQPGDADGLSIDAQLSVLLYGVRHKREEIESIGEIGQAKDFAVAYLNRSSIPKRRGLVTVDCCEAPFRYVSDDLSAAPQGPVAVAGFRVSQPDLEAGQFPERIAFSLQGDGSVQCRLEVVNRQRDPLDFLKGSGDNGSVSFSIASSGRDANYQAQVWNSYAGGAVGIGVQQEVNHGPDESGVFEQNWDATLPILRRGGSVHGLTIRDTAGNIAEPDPNEPEFVYRDQLLMTEGVHYTKPTATTLAFVAGEYPIEDEIVTHVFTPLVTA